MGMTRMESTASAINRARRRIQPPERNVNVLGDMDAVRLRSRISPDPKPSTLKGAEGRSPWPGKAVSHRARLSGGGAERREE